MKFFRLKSSSAAQTINFGRLFSRILKGGHVVVLEGDLGGGKTTFTKGVLAGLGHKGRVLSPSFTLLRQYNFKNLSVYHLDLYRLESSDIFYLGVDDFLYSGKIITLIEWGDKIKEELDKYIKIKFVFSGSNRREIEFSLKGYPAGLLADLNKLYGSYV